MTRLAPQDHEPVEIAPRRSFSKRRRLEILLAGAGKCGLCNGKIFGEFEVDHRIPLANGGADDASNWQAVHEMCHLEKTRKLDIPSAAKAKRQEKLRLDQPRTVSATPIRSRGFGPPRRKLAGKPRP